MSEFITVKKTIGNDREIIQSAIDKAYSENTLVFESPGFTEGA